jgi:hypothetical protein
VKLVVLKKTTRTIVIFDIDLSEYSTRANLFGLDLPGALMAIGRMCGPQTLTVSTVEKPISRVSDSLDTCGAWLETITCGTTTIFQRRLREIPSLAESQLPFSFKAEVNDAGSNQQEGSLSGVCSLRFGLVMLKIFLSASFALSISAS